MFSGFLPVFGGVFAGGVYPRSPLGCGGLTSGVVSLVGGNVLEGVFFVG